jgi:hypothetical protein
MQDAVSARVAAALDEGPRRRRQLETKRVDIQRRMENLVGRLVRDDPSPTAWRTIRERELEPGRLEQELAAEPADLVTTLTVPPSCGTGTVACSL